MKNEIRNFYGIISICSLIAAALLSIFWGMSANIAYAPAVIILGAVFIVTLQVYAAPYKAGRVIPFQPTKDTGKKAA
jgi:hypothetical protein